MRGPHEYSHLPIQFQAVLEAAPDAMLVTDRDGRVVLLNSQAERMLGYAASELLGQSVETLIPARLHGEHPMHRSEYFADGQARQLGAFGVEIVALRKDGQEIAVEIALSPVETDAGTFAITAMRDVSARKRVEAKFRGLLEAAPDAMVIADADGCIALVNAQVEKLFGYRRDELLGQGVETLIPERFRNSNPQQSYLLNPRARAAAAGIELFGRRKDGSEFPAEISSSPLETEEGRLAITAIRDVTARKRAEEERARLHARTKELEELKTKFFANVSHELRTPLALILGPVEKLLRGGGLQAGERRDLELVDRNARTLLKHVNDLLDIAKLEAGKVRPDYARVDVAQLVRLVAGHFDGLVAARAIAFELALPAELEAEVDPGKLQRILLNLLSNAFKFTPEGGRIRCSARASRGRLCIEVADSGPGVPAPHREAVFERFRQVESGPESALGGTGLGLAIARDFALIHEGWIAASEAPEGGALFVLELPVQAPEGAFVGCAPPADASADLARQAVEELRSSGQVRTRAARDGGRSLVLVVEDNAEMNRFICETLEPTYRVETAFDGEEGLRRALELRPDLVLTDIMMPRLSGDALVAKLRERDDLAGMPILVLTARADDELRLSLLGGGAQDYVMKPFSSAELLARVANLVAQKRTRDLLQGELDVREHDLEQLAREALQRKRQLETALLSVQVARDHAERASRLKSDFLGLVSHELRTPISALQLQVERLRHRDSTHSEKERDILRRASLSVHRLADLVESLLQYTRIESGRLSVELREFDAAALSAELVEEVKPLAEAKGLNLALHVAPSLPPLRSDPQLVRVIVVNLLANALKFTEHGSVELTVEQASEAHRLTLMDTGPGIAPADQARIFDPFEQLQPMRNKGVPGIGLGLALVREITRALGGTIELRSRLGHGSAFIIELPSQPAARSMLEAAPS